MESFQVLRCIIIQKLTASFGTRFFLTIKDNMQFDLATQKKIEILSQKFILDQLGQASQRRIFETQIYSLTFAIYFFLNIRSNRSPSTIFSPVLLNKWVEHVEIPRVISINYRRIQFGFINSFLGFYIYDDYTLNN